MKKEHVVLAPKVHENVKCMKEFTTKNGNGILVICFKDRSAVVFRKVRREGAETYNFKFIGNKKQKTVLRQLCAEMGVATNGNLYEIANRLCEAP